MWLDRPNRDSVSRLSPAVSNWVLLDYSHDLESSLPYTMILVYYYQILSTFSLFFYCGDSAHAGPSQRHPWPSYDLGRCQRHPWTWGGRYLNLRHLSGAIDGWSSGHLAKRPQGQPQALGLVLKSPGDAWWGTMHAVSSRRAPPVPQVEVATAPHPRVSLASPQVIGWPGVAMRWPRGAQNHRKKNIQKIIWT